MPSLTHRTRPFGGQRTDTMRRADALLVASTLAIGSALVLHWSARQAQQRSASRLNAIAGTLIPADASRISIPPYVIGRIGSAKLEWIAPPALRDAAANMRPGSPNSASATAAFRAYPESRSDSKVAYYALCQLDPDFRESEFRRLSGVAPKDDETRFRKTAATYLHYLALWMSSASAPSAYSPDEARRHLMYGDGSALSQCEDLWTDHRDPMNGLLLSALQVQLRPGFETERTQQMLLRTDGLIAVCAGEEAAHVYGDAKTSGWRTPPPHLASMDRRKAARLAAALSGPVGRLSQLRAGSNGEKIVDSRGNVLATQSPTTGEWTYLQKGTELWFLGNWKQNLIHDYDL